MKRKMCEFETCLLGMLSLARNQTFIETSGVFFVPVRYFVLSYFLPMVSDGTKIYLLSP